MAALLHLVIIVLEPDKTKARHHEEAGPDIDIAQIHPEQDRNADCRQDHQPAHRRRTDLGQMRLGPIVPDGLTLALANTQPANKFGPDQQPDDECCRDRAAGAERKIADQVQDAREVQIFRDQIQHQFCLPVNVVTIRPRPIAFEPLMRIARRGG